MSTLTILARRPALSQSVATNTSQTRSTWRCARNEPTNGIKIGRVWRRIHKCYRHPLANTRSKAETRGWPSTTHRKSTGGWALWRSRPDFSNLSAGLEKISYSPLISNRSFKPDSAWLGCISSFLKIDYPANRQSAGVFSKVHLQDFNFARSSQSSHFKGLQYDPISGRMVPAPLRSTDQPESAKQPDKPVIHCPPGSEIEAKFASNTTSVEDIQSQSGHSGANRHMNSQSKECPPGSELEALSAGNPTSFQQAHFQARAPEESTHKPNTQTACSPGNEFEAFPISESIPPKEPCTEDYRVRASTKPRAADTSLGAQTSIDCPPGSELETMFISKPATCTDQNSPIKALKGHSTAGQTGVSVEPLFGRDGEANFASGLPSGSTQHTPNYKASSDSIYCSPGSELKAKIVSDIANQENQQPQATEIVDMAPCSEPEAVLKTDSTDITNTRPEQAAPVEPANSDKAKIPVDCQPGNELEASIIFDKAMEESAEDIGALRASEIRARYAPKPRSTQEFHFDGSEDRVGDFLLQNQEATTEKAESTAYRILADDSSESRVTTAEAQSLFEDSDTAQPHEIQARLHNPAKFVPYLEQLQQEGFELVTGDGEILVFKKVNNHANQAVLKSTVKQDRQIHPSIPQYLRHDSYPTNNPGSPFQPLSGLGPSTPGEEASLTGPKNFFRRVFIAGSAIAASCFAIEEVIKYFRTGGQDGRGIDGFTAFESDRRRF